jgi:hypothetical protein
MFGRNPADRAAARVARAETKAAERAAKAEAKERKKAAKGRSKERKRASKARVKTLQAETKAHQAAAEAAAKAATGPARFVDTVTNPKTAKRALATVRVLAPAAAPFLLKAAVSTRAAMDGRRARRLGVTEAEVAAFRGPTGGTGARISGLSRSIDELADRKGNELQINRFAEVTRNRLQDLTTAVQASASMPPAGRKKVLRAVNRELDQISADLMTHLVGSAVALP